MDGDHTLERCREVTQAVLHEVFAALALQNVALEHIILKPSMVISGSTCSEQASVEQVAEASLSVYRECVPASVPTINFLSGGQSCELATAHLQAMNELSDSPWILSYSYGRALQAPALQAWQGKDENITAGQAALYKRAKLNTAATLGEYTDAMEDALCEMPD